MKLMSKFLREKTIYKGTQLKDFRFHGDNVIIEYETCNGLVIARNKMVVSLKEFNKFVGVDGFLEKKIKYVPFKYLKDNGVKVRRRL